MQEQKYFGTKSVCSIVHAIFTWSCNNWLPFSKYLDEKSLMKIRFKSLLETFSYQKAKEFYSKGIEMADKWQVIAKNWMKCDGSLFFE